MVILQVMSYKLETSIKNIKDGVSDFIKSLREIDHPETPNYEILIMNKKSRNSKRKTFFQMKDAMNYVTPQYLYDTENEYYLLDISKECHGCLQLNKIRNNGQNERSFHA